MQQTQTQLASRFRPHQGSYSKRSQFQPKGFNDSQSGIKMVKSILKSPDAFAEDSFLNSKLKYNQLTQQKSLNKKTPKKVQINPKAEYNTQNNLKIPIMRQSKAYSTIKSGIQKHLTREDQKNLRTAQPKFEKSIQHLPWYKLQEKQGQMRHKIEEQSYYQGKVEGRQKKAIKDFEQTNQRLNVLTQKHQQENFQNKKLKAQVKSKKREQQKWLRQQEIQKIETQKAKKYIEVLKKELEHKTNEIDTVCDQNQELIDQIDEFGVLSKEYNDLKRSNLMLRQQRNVQDDLKEVLHRKTSRFDRLLNNYDDPRHVLRDYSPDPYKDVREYISTSKQHNAFVRRNSHNINRRLHKYHSSVYRDVGRRPFRPLLRSSRYQ